MRLNGKDPTTLHRCISLSGEKLPGSAERDVITVESDGGEQVVRVSIRQSEYTVVLNIAGRTWEEAMEARAAIAAWASAGGALTAEAEPSKTPGKAYTVTLKSISEIEKRFGTVDVTFIVPAPVMHSIAPSSARGTNGNLHMMTGGTASVRPVLRITPDGYTENISLSVDGKAFFKLRGEIYAGQELMVDLERGAVTIDGAHAEDRIVYTDTDMDIDLAPGRHEFACSVPAAMTARWRDKWL